MVGGLLALHLTQLFAQQKYKSMTPEETKSIIADSKDQTAVMCWAVYQHLIKN